MVCVTVVAGIGETDLLLHLLTNVAPFKEVRSIFESVGVRGYLASQFDPNHHSSEQNRIIHQNRGSCCCSSSGNVRVVASPREWVNINNSEGTADCGSFQTVGT